MQIDVRSDAQIIKKQHALRARTIVVEELAKACTATSCKTRKCQVFRGTQLHRRLWQSWNKEELFKRPQYCCLFSPSEKLLQSESVHAYSVNSPPPHPRKKREVQFVDHLNNALNNSTVIAAKKRATTGLEPDQQLARRNSKFSIRAAEKRSLHLHDKRDICAGARGLGRGSASLGRGGSTTHELGGPLSRCHRPAEHTTALSTAQHNTAQRTIVRAETDRAALETETQDFTCLCAKWYENRRKPAAGWSDLA